MCNGLRMCRCVKVMHTHLRGVHMYTCMVYAGTLGGEFRHAQTGEGE